MIVGDSLTIIDYHQLSCGLDMFNFEIILDDSYCRLNERMIVSKNFSGSSFAKNGLKPKWHMVK